MKEGGGTYRQGAPSPAPAFPCNATPAPLLQVHNALGFAFFNMDKVGPAINEYKKAVDLQPGYVTGESDAKLQELQPGCLRACLLVCQALYRALPPPLLAHLPLYPIDPLPTCAPPAAWNNLGDAYERQKQYAPALAAYREVLTYAPDNKVAQTRSEFCRTRIERTA